MCQSVKPEGNDTLFYFTPYFTILAGPALIIKKHTKADSLHTEEINSLKNGELDLVHSANTAVLSVSSTNSFLNFRL